METYKYNLVFAEGRRLKYISVIIIILLSASSISVASHSLPWVKLTLSPSKTNDADSQIRLMPEQAEQTDGDAVTLYDKAINTFPKDFQQQQFSDWRKLPNELDQLPVVEIESALQNLKSTIDLLTQAARCKQCNWPYIKPEQVQQKVMDDLAAFRKFSYVLDVQAKLQIVQGHYSQAIETIRTNLTMANHLGGAPSLIQAMVGIAMGELTLNRIDQLIQSDNAPNLYQALKDLPQPLADVNKAMKVEIDNLQNYNIITRSLFRKQLEPAHEQVRKQMNHLDRKVTALQIIETLCLYAGTHNSKFPEKLSDITDIKIPNDPVTKKPFEYKSTGSEAVLTIEGTEGSDGRDSLHYELKMRE
jgi:hypothetical protein